MRIPLGNHDKQGDEWWFYLEFDDKAGHFNLITERISRAGDESESSVPLHHAQGKRGYIKAIAWIKDSLMKHGEAAP